MFKSHFMFEKLYPVNHKETPKKSHVLSYAYYSCDVITALRARF